jgi:hypothetical protein
LTQYFLISNERALANSVAVQQRPQLQFLRK